MNLNFAILQEELAPLRFKTLTVGEATSFNITHPQPYQRGETVKPGPVYIMDAHEAPSAIRCRKGTPSIICIGEQPTRWDLEKMNLMVVLDDISKESLLVRCLGVFQNYYRWETEMRRVIDEHLPLEEFGAVCQAVVRNPMVFGLSGLICGFHNADLLRRESRKRFREYALTYTERGELLQEGEMPSLDAISALVSSADYDRLARSDSPQLFRNPLLDYDSLIVRVSGSDGSDLGTLVVDGVQHDFTDRDIAVLSIAGRYLNRAIVSRTLKPAEQPDDLNQVIALLLAHALVDEGRIEAALATLGWEAEARFFAICIETHSYADATMMLSLANRLMLQLPSGYAVVHEDRIAVIVNLSKAGVERAEYLSRITSLLRDNLLLVGTSLPFEDFKDLYYYYFQAKKALELGRRQQPTSWRFDYADYQLTDLLTRAKGKHTQEACKPEGLRRLEAYDLKHESNLVPLLTTFLECGCNIAETSRAAYIHRNTCLYRLGRINEVTDDDFTDHRTRLLYEIALAMKG